ncbi:MAG: hypothetical protein H7125_18955 [Proteobacteria bacterium]|nr:hypothetical protein [Burkholderiales bacterium]
MEPFRHQIYEALGRERGAFLEYVAREAAADALPAELRGSVALSGSQSVRPAYLLPAVIERMVDGARSAAPLTTYLDEIRVLVKQHYGDDYDGVPVCTCEAALWLCLEAFATPPSAGRGAGYRSAYLALHEAYSEHFVSYGRPFPPKYKDLFGERLTTSGEMGIVGHRLPDLDVVIVPMAGARYEQHGIKQFIVPLLTGVDAAATIAAVGRRAATFAERLSAVVSLGYDTPGYGYGSKADGVHADLMTGLGRVAADHDVPYIVDNARAVPFLGVHPRGIGADLMLFSMDKVAGAPTSGLIVGRAEYVLQLQRALGWHSDRVGSGASTYGKGAYSPFDPGRESLVGQAAALRWVSEHPQVIRGVVDELYELLQDAVQPLRARYPDGIRIAKSYNGFGVELNYVDTWRDGRIGIPIFNNEDKGVGSNLVIAGLAALGWQPPSAEDGNLFITTGRGLVDAHGRLFAERARRALRALVRVLEILDDTTQAITARLAGGHARAHTTDESHSGEHR